MKRYQKPQTTADAVVCSFIKPSSKSTHADNPTGVLGANPFPEVTDPVCRLPLPTLFCRPEAFSLGDLLRLTVRPDARE